LFAPFNRAAPGHLTPAGRLGDRPVERQVLQVQTDHLVEGGDHDLQHLLPDTGFGLLDQPAADRAVRAAWARDAFVAAAVHQRGDQWSNTTRSGIRRR
jgi:hypothetical protein